MPFLKHAGERDQIAFTARALKRVSVCHTSLCDYSKKRVSMSSNQTYYAEVFRPVGQLQRKFRLSFMPIIREENLAAVRLSILVDIRVGDDQQKPFILSGNEENFCLSSNNGRTFLFKKVQCETPSYEVFLDNHWAWVSRLGNQGLELLIREYVASKRRSRQFSYR